MKSSKKLLVVATLISVFLVGCAGIKTRRQIRGDEMGSESVTDATPKKATESQRIKMDPTDNMEDMSEALPPTPPPMRKYVQPPTVGIVLGPGGAKALAHTGVLKQLQKNRVPINHIVGVEWGALVGALYAQEAKIHDVEWKMYKLKPDSFMGRGFFTSKLEPVEASRLSPFLASSFGGKKIASGTIPFSCPSLSLKNGRLSWMDSDLYQKTLLYCLPLPPLFQAYNERVAAAFSIKDAVQFLKTKGMELIVVVDVISQDRSLFGAKETGEIGAQIYWHELRRYYRSQQASLRRAGPGLKVEFISVNTSKYSPIDFKDKKAIMALGERAGLRRGRMISEKYGF